MYSEHLHVTTYLSKNKRCYLYNYKEWYYFYFYKEQSQFVFQMNADTFSLTLTYIWHENIILICACRSSYLMTFAFDSGP